MKILLRTDASVDIGTGHVMRCLTLADVLKSKGAQAYFVCRELPGNLCDLIESKGHKVCRLPFSGTSFDESSRYAAWLGVPWEVDAEETKTFLVSEGGYFDWLVVDHYALGEAWEKRMRPFVNRLMVIDDLLDRSHDCDLLLNQNYFGDSQNLYEGLVPSNCRKLMGPRYVLMREEFLTARKDLRTRNGVVHRILVFFGGSDHPANETGKTLLALKRLNRTDIAVDLVVGPSNPNREAIKKLCDGMPNVNLHFQVESMTRLIVEADLAIGAGGTTTWERCYLGLPSIVVILAENQQASIDALAEAGAVWNLGYHDKVTADDIFAALKKATDDYLGMRRMTLACFRLFDDSISGKDAVTDLIIQDNNVPITVN